MGVTAVACTGGGADAQEPAVPSVPSEFAATFDVESPMGLVAGDGQAWVLTADGAVRRCPGSTTPAGPPTS